MAFSFPKSARLSRDQAEAIGVEALGFLASEPQRLAAFLGASGLDLAEVRARAGDPDLLAGVLDHLVRDESLLLVFAAEASHPPERVVMAGHVLAGDIAP
ncbi:MAG: DUF3572 domain-containing protein [Hyphomicrobiaceae bacterium]|nr:DUF3572 domain-containing protein [Hyphomicrobiaceae bacterium]